MAGESRINHVTRNPKNLLQHALVVDNDPVSLDSLKGLLQQCCYYVITVSDASKALELAIENKGSFDVLIADIYIWSIEGFKLLENLANVLPVILLSPTADQKLSEIALAKGACHCLKKPVQSEDLQNILHYINQRKQTLDKISSHPEDKHAIPDSMDQNGRSAREDCKDEHNTDPASKKRRLVWDDRLKEKFVKAYNELGPDNVKPKNLQEKMNEPGLSRSHIASHLQKYRNYLKRVEVKKLQQVATSRMLSNDMMICGRTNALTEARIGGNKQFIEPDHSRTPTRMSQMQHGMEGRQDSPPFMNMSPCITFNSGHHQHLASPQNSRSCCYEVSQTRHLSVPSIGPHYSCTSTRMSQMEHGMIGRQDCRPSYEPSNNSNCQPPLLPSMLDQPEHQVQPPSNEVSQTQHPPAAEDNEDDDYWLNKIDYSLNIPSEQTINQNQEVKEGKESQSQHPPVAEDDEDDDDWVNMIDNLLNIPGEQMINQNQEVKEGNGPVSLSSR